MRDFCKNNLGPFGNLVSHFVCIHFAKALLEEPIYLVDPVGAIKQALAKAEASLLAHTQKKVILLGVENFLSK